MTIIPKATQLTLIPDQAYAKYPSSRGRTLITLATAASIILYRSDNRSAAEQDLHPSQL